MARIYFNPEYCKGCFFCIEFCPRGVFKSSERMNKKGYVVPEVAREEACTGCMICEWACPDFALVIEKEKKGVSA